MTVAAWQRAWSSKSLAQRLQWVLVALSVCALGWNVVLFYTSQMARDRRATWAIRAEVAVGKPLKRGTSIGNDFDWGNFSTTRGILIAVHETNVALAVGLIRQLRCLGNQEIIQVVHCFPEELTVKSRWLLTRNDARVEIVDVCSRLLSAQTSSDTRRVNKSTLMSFQSSWLKPLAVYHSNLTEVILLDPDILLLRDPASLRHLPAYLSTGTVFFYDRVVKRDAFFNRQINVSQSPTNASTSQVQYLHQWLRSFDYKRFNVSQGYNPSKQLRESFAFRQLTSHEQDSSMILINKGKAGVALEILKYLIMEKRFKYAFSWRDKESFWLSYEFAHKDYFFSPWGASALSSGPNKDLERHPSTLCGDVAHFMPVTSEEDDSQDAELLFVNAKGLLEPFPLGLEATLEARTSQLNNVNPTHVTPRQKRTVQASSSSSSLSHDLVALDETEAIPECLTGLGATPLSEVFFQQLMQRRLHFMAAETELYEALDHCRVHASPQ